MGEYPTDVLIFSECSSGLAQKSEAVSTDDTHCDNTVASGFIDYKLAVNTSHQI